MALTIPTQVSMVRRITKAFRAASPEHYAAGMGWYRYCYLMCSRIAAGSARPDDVARVVGVFAALSPRCQLSTNVLWTEIVIAAADAGLPMPAVSTESNRATAWAIANGVAPLDALGTLNKSGKAKSGMKVRAFFANIMGNVYVVTCDVWAAKVATGSPSEDLVGSPVGYAAVQAAYQRAAVILGVTPQEVQAVTWTAARGIKPTDVDFHAACAELALAA